MIARPAQPKHDRTPGLGDVVIRKADGVFGLVHHLYPDAVMAIWQDGDRLVMRDEMRVGYKAVACEDGTERVLSPDGRLLVVLDSYTAISQARRLNEMLASLERARWSDLGLTSEVAA